jgi:sulfide:quinone oxidoreductase
MPDTQFHAVICGGGVAAVEGLLRLRTLADDAVTITLLAPGEVFVHRPLTVREAVGFAPGRRYALGEIAEDAGADWIKDTLAGVDTTRRLVHTGAGREIPYDGLLVAVGGRQEVDLEHCAVFNDADASAIYNAVVAGVEHRHVRSVAFVVPEGPVYPLPVYELALLTASAARAAGVAPRLSIVTPEPIALAAFGTGVGVTVSGVLAAAGIRVYTSASAYAPGAHELLVQPHGVELSVDRIVTMPRIIGPNIDGLRSTAGFIPIDSRCTVPGTEGRVFAAGDAAAFPVKHGGLGAQQADAAAAAMAVLAGADTVVEPFQPEIRGKLLTGGEPLNLSATIVGSQGFNSELSHSPPWPVDDKLVAEELGPYLAAQDAARG